MPSYEYCILYFSLSFLLLTSHFYLSDGELVEPKQTFQFGIRNSTFVIYKLSLRKISFYVLQCSITPAQNAIYGKKTSVDFFRCLERNAQNN